MYNFSLYKAAYMQIFCSYHDDNRGKHNLGTRRWFNMKIPYYQYRYFHHKDETVVKPFYPQNGIPLLVRRYLDG